MKGSEELIYKRQIKEHMFSLAQQWLWGDHQIADEGEDTWRFEGHSQQKGIWR